MNLILVLFTLFAINSAKTLPHFVGKDHDAEKTSEYWSSKAKLDLFTAYTRKDITHRAKNVIIFLGDGMGMSTITPARILKGQQKKLSGEEERLVFEDFPNTCLIKTYNIDYQVPDSAGTATAFLTGTKTNKGVIGVNANVNRKETNCEIVRNNKLNSIFARAFEKNKSTGVITTTRVTHATPAAGYASIADRDWEGSIPDQQNQSSDPDLECKDIARQLVENHPGNKLNVILGGGARYLYPKNDTKRVLTRVGEREDGLDIVEKWNEMRKKAGLKQGQFEFVNNTEGLLKAKDNEELEYLFGVFNDNYMSYDVERDANEEPSIEEMTETAIKVLQKNTNGYVLLVEGGRIDTAHHDSYANLALYEAVAFDRAIERALQLVSTDDTLIVVTADHSHAFTMNGYPSRGHNIMGIADKDEESSKPFTTLMYANGPGHVKDRPDPSLIDTTEFRYQSYAGVYLESANHGGEDVALYSIGPMSHLFRGTKEQSYVAHAMEMAACLGDYQDYEHCKNQNNSSLPLMSRKTSIYLFLGFILINISFVLTKLSKL